MSQSFDTTTTQKKLQANKIMMTYDVTDDTAFHWPKHKHMKNTSESSHKKKAQSLKNDWKPSCQVWMAEANL